MHALTHARTDGRTDGRTAGRYGQVAHIESLVLKTKSRQGAAKQEGGPAKVVLTSREVLSEAVLAPKQWWPEAVARSSVDTKWYFHCRHKA